MLLLLTSVKVNSGITRDAFTPKSRALGGANISLFFILSGGLLVELWPRPWTTQIVGLLWGHGRSGRGRGVRRKGEGSGEKEEGVRRKGDEMGLEKMGGWVWAWVRGKAVREEAVRFPKNFGENRVWMKPLLDESVFGRKFLPNLDDNAPNRNFVCHRQKHNRI